MLRIQPQPHFNQRITMNKKSYQNTMLGVVIIFGITALFSVMAFFMAMIALCR
jgi:hypothetical protein